MTANQMIIPLCALTVVVVVAVLIGKARRRSQAVVRAAPPAHRPHSPVPDYDRGSIAHSAMAGHMSNHPNS